MRISRVLFVVTAALGATVAVASDPPVAEAQAIPKGDFHNCDYGFGTFDCSKPQPPDGFGGPGVQAGATACCPTLTDSSYRCVDTKTDPNNCGGCDISAEPTIFDMANGKTMSCEGGKVDTQGPRNKKDYCEKETGKKATYCKYATIACHDLENDVDNCGRCGHSCGGYYDWVCRRGHCTRHHTPYPDPPPPTSGGGGKHRGGHGGGGAPKACKHDGANCTDGSDCCSEDCTFLPSDTRHDHCSGD
jgi:hypothetical protein